MILNNFRAWTLTASAHGRAEGAASLARAYLSSSFDAEKRGDAVRLLTGFVDDPSPLVRRALAEAFASSGQAPHHIVLALADDQSSIASIVLQRSPVLTDAELIDCAATADAAAQAAIASRPLLSAAVAMALAEFAAPEALVAIGRNLTAAVPASAFRRMIERHPDHAPLRQALLTRDDLPPCVRVDLVDAVSMALATFMSQRNELTSERMKRVAHDYRDQAIITIFDRARNGRRDLIKHLRQGGYLTVSFALRAILSGKVDLFKAVLGELSGVSPMRVDAVTMRHQGTGFATLYRKAGLPKELLPAFRISLEAVKEIDWMTTRSAALSCRAIERVLTGCETISGASIDKLMVLLRRFEAEAARDAARTTPMFGTPAPLPHRIEAATPLLLSDLDRDDYNLPANHGRQLRIARREPRRPIVVDLAAIEAELLAA